MLHKIILTGSLMMCLLFIPGILGERYPPFWVMALIITLGLSGFAIAFVGTLIKIWG